MNTSGNSPLFPYARELLLGMGLVSLGLLRSVCLLVLRPRRLWRRLEERLDRLPVANLFYQATVLPRALRDRSHEWVTAKDR
jgi:hypothetical protein